MARSDPAQRGVVSRDCNCVGDVPIPALQTLLLDTDPKALADVTGINGEDGRLVSTLTKRDAERLIKAGVIDGGMLPKVESSLRALTGGAQKAHIIDGRVPHAILLEVLTKEGIGTEIAL